METEGSRKVDAADQKLVGTRHGGSVEPSAERSRRYERARAAFEMAEAGVAVLQAAEEMAAGSATESVGRRLDDVRSDTGSSGPSPPIRETAQENPFAGVYALPPTTTTTITPTPTIYDIFSEKRGVHIIDEIGISNISPGISASAGSHPPSGCVISASAGSLSGGGPRPLSVVSASAGLLNPREVISASAGSSRPPKHDRHGNPVSAPAAHSHPGSVVSASAGHGQGGGDSGSVQSAPNSVAPFPLFKGGATADFPWTAEPPRNSPWTAEPPPDLP